MERRTGSPPQFIFFGGKGGVGKTTCAAACAVAAGSMGSRVLVVSTDPAHSLGDALGVRLSSRVTPIRGAGRVSAVELDAPRAFARWLEAHRQALGDALEHGTWLDRNDVDALLGLSIPGVDELIGMLEIVRLATHPPHQIPSSRRPVRRSRSGSRAVPAVRASSPGLAGIRGPYDKVVIDTAPTGHTLRLLAAPATVANVATLLDRLQQEHRVIREQIAGVVRPEAADRLIELLARQAEETGALLRDSRRATFRWVTLPERLSLAESDDAVAELGRSGIMVAEVIVNRVIPSGPACPLCDRRRNEEAGIITRVRRRLSRGRTLRMIPAELREPRGVNALERIGRLLLGRPRDFSSHARLPTGRMPRPPHSWRPAAPESLDAFLGARLIFFGGKGGVGKTTAAAAAAVHLARAAPDRRVLLLSTDPAHSIGDAFGAPLGDRPTHVARGPANLHAREVDAAAALASRRTALEEAFREITGAVGATDAEALLDAPRGGALMDLAPPGIDELFGMLSVVEMLEPGKSAEALEPLNAVTPREQPAYDLIVVDTAPTGHALRLLEIPEAVRGWVQLLIRVLLKYRSLARPGQLAADLVELSKSIRSLQALIRNPLDTRFIVVTRAAALPAAETERLLKRLRRLTLSVPAIVVNAVTMVPGRCPRCRATAAAERAALLLLTRLRNHRSRGCVIIQTPLTAPPPRGVAALDRWGRSWSTAT